MKKYKTKIDILSKAQEANMKTFGELDKKGRLSQGQTKGVFGHIIEESLFEYKINSSKEPDFNEAGVELKVVPFKKLKKNGYSAKERIVLNIIDFMNENLIEFEKSSFWVKNHSLLLMFYLYEYDVDISDLVIYGSLIFEYPEEDLLIIKQDWKKIASKIKSGLAHELSESDTLYLGACPKGANSYSKRVQPFSSIMAMQRAYSFKNSYVTQILNKYIINDEKNYNVYKNIDELNHDYNLQESTKTNSIIKDYRVLCDYDFEDYILFKFKQYIGKTTTELIHEFNINSNSKSINHIIFSKILDVDNIKKSEEFLKANIKVKTINQKANNEIVESMSFPAFQFSQIIKESWDESQIRSLFEETRFMFVVFKEDFNGLSKLHKIKFWNMPIKVLDTDYKFLWEDTVEKIRKGEIVKSIGKNGLRKTYFLKSSEHPIGHIRPHARNALDVYPLPVIDKLTGVSSFTKQCFWLNNRYIESILDN